jgi:hypothetical protein
MKIIIIPVVDLFSFIYVTIVIAQQKESYVHSVKACLEIGNIEGKGNVTCEGDGSHNYENGGVTFHDKDTIWILVRMQNL